jgi:hypothetical protein
MFQGDMWIFAGPDPVVVGIGFTSDMKRALTTENYGVQKSLIVLYSMDHLHTEFLADYFICIRMVLNGG